MCSLHTAKEQALRAQNGAVQLSGQSLGWEGVGSQLEVTPKVKARLSQEPCQGPVPGVELVAVPSIKSELESEVTLRVKPESVTGIRAMKQKQGAEAR